MGNSSSREGGTLSVGGSCPPLTRDVSWSVVEVFCLFIGWLVCLFGCLGFFDVIFY